MTTTPVCQVRWTADEAIALGPFGDEQLRIKIGESGQVGRWLPNCCQHLAVLAEGYAPLKHGPLASEAEAQALIDTVRRLSGMTDTRGEV